MAYTAEQIRAIFQSKFNVSTWTDFIINFFKAQTLKRVPEPLDIDPEEGAGYYWGKLSTSDTYDISFFYLKMAGSIDRRKVGLRQLISKYVKIDSDAGIAVFDDGNHWRLSFITDLRGERTSPKRFTFVFGDRDNHYRTAVDRFVELQRKGISFANIKDAFSVEALTMQFYNDLFNWYTWALKEDTGVYFPKTPDKERNRLDTKMIRLITRLMFVWFIKQKGLIPGALFDPEEISHWLNDFDPLSMTSANYYQAILQNLFFATLNRPIQSVSFDKDGNEVVERRCFATLKDKPDVKSKYRYQELFKVDEDTILRIFEHIPFINGGLFECLDKNRKGDGVEQAYYEDGFSRSLSKTKDERWTRRAFVPNKLFFDPDDGIISIFSRYNFTVEENSPQEQQIALDPELLGKVFENLLGVYNPETHDTARDQSGSFYTPREIVNYMVDISLQAYLGNTDEVKTLFVDDFEYDLNKEAFYKEVITKLKTIKVLDPACGSGAFPIGMLNRIVEIMQNLNAQGSKYDLKLQIMENCIFGGDIQTIAAQITKLRFFISLICDCNTDLSNPDSNFGVPNLPNLETHFVTCDSLIALKRPRQYSLFEQDVIELQKKLQEIRKDHFIAKTMYQKTKLRDRDKELRDELTLMLQSDDVVANESAKMMAQWNPYDQNGQAEFFDSKWMFGIDDGFDIVIGNPPYIRRTKIPQNKKTIYEKYYQSAVEQYDMYLLFIERGMSLLKEGGALCYINPIRFFNSNYGVGCRELISKNYQLDFILDVSQLRVFREAQTYPCILNIKKSKCTDNHLIKYIRLNHLEELSNVPENNAIHVSQGLIKKDNYYRFLIGTEDDYRINTTIEHSNNKLISFFEIARGLANKLVDFNGNKYDAIKSKFVHKYYIDTPIKVDTKSSSLFLNEMIILPRSVKHIIATYKEKNIICLDRIYYLEPKHTVKINLYYIIGILNSHLLTYWFEFNYFTTKIKGNYFDLNGDQIGSIPIAAATPETEMRIADIVISILDKKHEDNNAYISELEDELNSLIYEVYGINKEDALTIENKIKHLFDND